MSFIADLHIHSKYSRATSRQLDLEHLWIWAQRKGITVVGTADFTHPGWFAELEQKLAPAEPGLFRLRPELERELAGEVPDACRGEVRFLLSVEISNIYKRDDRTRKVHNLILAPDLAAASRLNAALDRIGNITSDGRPILGLDSRDLLELTLEASDEAALIPAHIWTPWFSALGSRSGFDSIEQCYADLAGHIFAVETGLSSDPPMNWRLSALDRYTLISNSDAHSPAKLGREANIFHCGLSYPEMMAALRDRGGAGFGGTIEFFPEEGKYHLDGHRKCGMRLWPEETRRLAGVCFECGKPLVLGVMNRVEQLADRPDGSRPDGAAPFRSLVGLAQVLGEVHGVGQGTKTVARHLDRLTRAFGAELGILQEVPLEDLHRHGGSLLQEAVRRMRDGEVHIQGGFDGEYGVVRLIEPSERRRLAGLGIARAKTAVVPGEPTSVGAAGEEAVVDGVRGKWRVDPAYLEDLDGFEGRVAVISPLDRLIIDRKRMEELFEFDYQLEMFKPAAKRRWGYWAMPVLVGDRLVGKVDATAERDRGVLRVDAIHEDEPWSAKDRKAVRAEVEALARWLDLEPELP